MSKYEVNGKLRNIDDNLFNRAAMEQIDEYQMKIYEIMKHAFPEMVGYEAVCYEMLTDDGELDIKTEFYMARPKEDNDESKSE